MVFDHVFSMTRFAIQIWMSRRVCTIAGTVGIITEYGEIRPGNRQSGNSYSKPMPENRQKKNF
jgi:hypothetical protein